MTTMVLLLVLGYIIGYLISVVMVSGWSWAKDYVENKELPAWYTVEQIATRNAEDKGFAVFWATLFSIVWPLFLPAAFCITGFAHKGWKPIWQK